MQHHCGMNAQTTSSRPSLTAPRLVCGLVFEPGEVKVEYDFAKHGHNGGVCYLSPAKGKCYGEWIVRRRSTNAIVGAVSDSGSAGAMRWSFQALARNPYDSSRLELESSMRSARSCKALCARIGA